MLRAWCSDWNGAGELPPLSHEERHHLVRVRRVRPGEPVEVLNGRGGIARCRVEAAGPRDIRLVLQETDYVAPPRLRCHLLVALPKGKTFPAILHKAVELGVAAITPLVSEHAEAPADRAELKRERFAGILVEAVKQSGNPWMPELTPPLTPAQALAASPAATQRLCAALQPDARPLWSLLGDPLQPSGTIEVYVGPEGDFSAAEYRLLREAGCVFASLGPLVLKVETAASLVMGVLALWSQRDRPA